MSSFIGFLVFVAVVFALYKYFEKQDRAAFEAEQRDQEHNKE